MADRASNLWRAAAEVGASYADLGISGYELLTGEEGPEGGLIGYLEREGLVQAQPSEGYEAQALKGTLHAASLFVPLGAAAKLAKGTSLLARAGRAILTPAPLAVELSAGAGAGVGAEAARRHAPDSVVAQIAGGVVGGLATGGVVGGGIALARRGSFWPSAKATARTGAGETAEETVAQGAVQSATQNIDAVNTSMLSETPLATPASWAGQQYDEMLDSAQELGEYAFQQAADATSVRQSLDEAAEIARNLGHPAEVIDRIQMGSTADAAMTLGIDEMMKEGWKRYEVAQLLKSQHGDAMNPMMLQELKNFTKVNQLNVAWKSGKGRGLRAARDTVFTSKMSRAILQRFSEFVGMDDDQMANAAANFTLDQATEAAQQIAKPAGWGRKLLELWKMSLLSGPKTHLINPGGNAAYNLQNIIETYLEASAGSILRRVPRARLGENMARFSEANARLVGTLEGMQDGAKAFWRTLREGEDALMAGKAELHAPAIGGRTGEIVRWPALWLQAEDAFGRGMARSQIRRQLAMQQAREEVGNQGRSAIRQRYQEIVDSGEDLLTDKYKNVLESQVSEIVFQAELGKAAAHGQKMLHEAPALQAIIPFYKTPLNIFKGAVQRTPVGLIKAFRTTDKRERARLASQAMIGSGISTFFINETMKGNITGGYPSDPGKRKVWEGANRKPYSVNSEPLAEAMKAVVPESAWDSFGLEEGSNWVQYLRVEPAGSTIGAAADVAQIIDQLADEPEWQAEVAPLLITATMQNFGSKTWLQGMSSAVNAMTDPDRYAQKFVEGYVGSLIPAIVAQPVTAIDGVQRDVDGLIDALRARIYPSSLEPRISIYGQELKRESLGPDIVSPIYTGRETRDMVAQFLLKMDASVLPPQRTIGDYRMTSREYRQLSQTSGNLAYRQLRMMIAGGAFDRMPEELVDQQVKAVYRNARSAVREELKAYLRKQGKIRNNPVTGKLEKVK